MKIRHKHIFLLFTFLLMSISTSAADVVSSDSAVVKSLQAEGVVFSHDNSVVLFKNGQEKFDDMFAAIRQAKHSVHLEYFNFRNDSIAGLLFDILAEKVKEGVKVRALFDAFGNSSNNKPLKKKHLKNIRDRGIEIYEYSPIVFPWVNHVWTRDHRKIVVIDGKVAYTGGMNVADYYIKGTEQVGEWRDMHCRIEGSAVNELQKIFLRIWNETSGQHVTGVGEFQGGTDVNLQGVRPDTTVTKGSKMVGIANREPHTSNQIMRTLYYQSIQNAESHIQIINPYFSLTHKLKKHLKQALKRGVKVEIIISSKYDEPITPDIGFRNAHKLMQAGADIYIYMPGFHHSKAMTVDGKFCTVGSTNLDARSLMCDLEDNAVIMDRHTTKELSRIFEADRDERCIKLTEEKWKKMRTPWQRFRGQLFSILTRFL
ncbi:MAG: cardiolipin synthase [Prevotella sp.]|nr:cardiolipin synthase [Candidatus Equicola stercoris]